jgi:hypothetical protein
MAHLEKAMTDTADKTRTSGREGHRELEGCLEDGQALPDHHMDREERGHEHHHEEGHHHRHEHHEHGHHHHKHVEVLITINTVEKPIHSGSHTVVEIKKLGGIPLADDLNEVIHGKLTPLTDDGAVEICGGEVFLSHPKDGGSSSH